MSDDDWTWDLSSAAQDDLAALDAHEQDRILDKLDEIVDSPWRDPPITVNPSRTAHTGRSESVHSGFRYRSIGAIGARLSLA